MLKGVAKQSHEKKQARIAQERRAKTIKELLKTTEAIVVLLGLALTVILGKFWAFVTGAAYIFINLPNAWHWVKTKIGF